MSGTELAGTGRRGWRRIGALLLAAALAAVFTMLAAASASADTWPSGEPNGQTALSSPH